MEVSTVDLIISTLPEELKEEGKRLIDNARQAEEQRLTQNSKFRRHSKPKTSEEIQEKRNEVRQKARLGAEPLGIAKLIMEVWSPQMRRHAEKVILNKAVQLDYLKESHLKWVNVLDNDDMECISVGDDWVVDDQDEVIIELIWNRFNIKQHFEDTRVHRVWIQRSYDRLKTFLPKLVPEVIERHDITKFAFSQAIGYTLKWVHSIYHNIWKTACDLHLHNEPHHPQSWSSTFTPQEKKLKLERWLADVCDFHNGCPYGIQITSLNLKSENLAETFLQESFIDMVAIEWERKKGQRLDISLRELVYMDYKFLQRYTPIQNKVVRDLIESIISMDHSWQSVELSDREKRLLSTVPEDQRARIVCQIENQKKSEVERQKRLAKADEGTVVLSSKVHNEAVMKGHDIAYFITACRVATELWNEKYKTYVENVILKKAIEEQYIKESDKKWVSVFNPVVEEGNEEEFSKDDDLVLQILWEDFKLKQHFSAVTIHRYWVKQSYRRLSHFMKEIPEEVIERHDLTKFSLSQSLGYSLKWIHNINYPVWRKACNMHLHHEPHHPEMWSNKNNAEDKLFHLESWLCHTNGGSNYGLDINTIDFASENMTRMFLKESFLDMVAVEWERNKGQRDDLTFTELVYMEDRFLARYSQVDKDFILDLMSTIRQVDKVPIKSACTPNETK